MTRPPCVAAAAAAALLAAGCGRADAPEPPRSAAGKAPADTAASAPAGTLALVPASARLDQVNTLPRDPRTAPLPDDEYTAAQIRRGYDIVRNPRQHAARFAGNDLSCANCHMNGGQRDRALPYVGIAGTFPQYRSRDGRLISLEDRIGDCFERSLDGTRPPYDSPEMMAVAAYITWLSQGQPVGEDPAWRGKNRIARENQIPIERLDRARGEQLYVQWCASCHGMDGRGVDLGVAKPGPLWGPGSWNDGAGAARVYTLAGYIRHAMPLTNPGSLSDEEAQHVAAYINSHERPSFARKREDFPNGDVPVDAVYYPQRYARNPLSPK
jgi:thiosulfate dehydrogenase